MTPTPQPDDTGWQANEREMTPEESIALQKVIDQTDDTGEAIERILYDYTFASRNPEGYGKGMAEARTALQALIQEESAHARFTEAFHIAKLESISGLPEANNRIAEGWNGAERSSDD